MVTFSATLVPKPVSPRPLAMVLRSLSLRRTPSADGDFLVTLGSPSGPLSKLDRPGTDQDQDGRLFILKQTSGCCLGTVFHREVTIEPAGECREKTHEGPANSHG